MPPFAEFEKAESAANAVEERVKAVHDKIMEVSGGKVKAAQKKLDDATKKREKVGDVGVLFTRLFVIATHLVKWMDDTHAM